METIDLVKVLVDTSIWVEYFRGNEAVCTQLLPLIDAGSVAVTGLIIGELRQGIRNSREAADIENLAEAFVSPDISLEMWIRAGRLSAAMRKSGLTIPLSDCAIATLAHHYGYSLLTRDKHFSQLQTKLKLQLLQ